MHALRRMAPALLAMTLATTTAIATTRGAMAANPPTRHGR